MGVAALWQLLRSEELVEWYRGGITEEHAALVAAVDGQAVAIDLSTWIMQADQQTALTPHFSREERCMKVTFERALQWLRHGCLPVAVVEGRPPAEKLAAQRARFEARNGYAGGGSQAGAAQFQRLGQAVGRLLEELGLPVFYAPGEAEAVCAALNRAGCVDAAASSDSDTLLYGAETLLQSLKLSTTQKDECELKRVRMASIRRRLGMQQGGAKALGVLAALSGSDYDLDGAQGVGSAGGLAIARHLLQGDADDSQVLQRLAGLVQRPPKQELLELTHCTGCQSCGHEGGRKGKIKRHSSRNRCACCPPAEDGSCQLVSFERCGCAFHRLETERRVERILERVRANPGFLQEAQAALAVFERQGREADAYVDRRLAELRCQRGQRLRWLHRPRVQGVFDIIDAKRRQMLWDMAAVRSKLLPVLLEWDMQQQAASAEQGGASEEAEFRAAAIQKVHGLKSKGDKPTDAHWRYVVSWERLEGNAEQLGMLEVRPKKPRAGSKAAAAAAATEVDGQEHGSFLGSQAPSQALSQAATQQPGSFSPGGSQVEHLTARQFDLRWLKEQPAEHRAVRITAVHRLVPHLETAWQEQLAGAGRGSKGAGGAARKPGRAGGKKGAAPGSAGKGPARAAVAEGGGAVGRLPRQLLSDEGGDGEEEGGAGAGRAAAQQQRPQRPQAPDITRYLTQRRPGSAAARAAAGKAAAGGQAGRGYGLAASGADPTVAASQQKQPSYQLHLPDTATSMQALMSRALGTGSGQQQQEGGEQRRRQQQHHPPPQQRASPSKKLRSPRGHTGADVAGPSPGGRSAGADSDFEVLLTSPESAAKRTQPRRASHAEGVAATDGADSGSDEDLVPLALALDMAGMAPPEGRSPGSVRGDEGGERQQRAPLVAQQQRQRQAPLAAQQQRQQQLEVGRPTQQAAQRCGWRRSSGGAGGAEVVDLVTPPLPARPQLPAAGRAAGGHVDAPARRHSAGSSKQQAAPGMPAPLSSSPIDLTFSDDD